MRMALLLIKDPANKLNTIAVQLGYSSLCSFSRAFKKHFGVNPSQMRAGNLAAASFAQKLSWLSQREVARLRQEWIENDKTHNTT